MPLHQHPPGPHQAADVPPTLVFLDEADVQLCVLDAALHCPRIPLSEATAPARPGAYLIFYIGGLAWYAPVARAEYPVYVGSASDLRDRMRRHRRNTAPVVNLHGGNDLHVALLPTTSDGSALFAEALLRSLLRPVWNEHALRGFGSRSQGPTRTHQAPPPWSLMHPGRHVGVGPTALTASGLEAAAMRHLSDTARPAWKAL